ncbi:hypothetical protein [Roseateles sp. BYS96W]|uniref:Uncharacterized protein n=1 Tax=Pelomonas nitida TaxID=3299027 RepID=A0ABW7G5V5_9BURK
MRFVPALRFFRRSAAVRSEPDPADLGTAFGLDACLEGGVSEYRQQAPFEQLESQAGQLPAQDSPLSWLSRRSA